VRISSGNVGGGDGAIERFVGVAEPARALVVEVGQRAFFQLGRRLDALGDDAVGIAPRRFAGRLRPAWEVSL